MQGYVRLVKALSSYMIVCLTRLQVRGHDIIDLDTTNQVKLP